ncbi:hypothetical protein NDU88_006143 [Pleurodeles waltl]|uniref:Uncharacterized protein n=1 Tax=Pleurodeles waltl TaxID=8319 RepID=A0AAV7NU98_PLEWA|nr:hypothetical protein NDU88_006143 [Pleurodeles waltl]
MGQVRLLVVDCDKRGESSSGRTDNLYTWGSCEMAARMDEVNQHAQWRMRGTDKQRHCTKALETARGKKLAKTTLKSDVAPEVSTTGEVRPLRDSAFRTPEEETEMPGRHRGRGRQGGGLRNPEEHSGGRRNPEEIVEEEETRDEEPKEKRPEN